MHKGCCEDGLYTSHGRAIALGRHLKALTGVLFVSNEQPLLYRIVPESSPRGSFHPPKASSYIVSYGPLVHKLQRNEKNYQLAITYGVDRSQGLRFVLIQYDQFLTPRSAYWDTIIWTSGGVYTVRWANFYHHTISTAAQSACVMATSERKSRQKNMPRTRCLLPRSSWVVDLEVWRTKLNRLSRPDDTCGDENVQTIRDNRRGDKDFNFPSCWTPRVRKDYLSGSTLHSPYERISRWLVQSAHTDHEWEEISYVSDFWGP